MTDLDLMVTYFLMQKSITESARKNATTHCGPGESFPVDADGEHLRAAWDLAGHAADPSAVRDCIKRFAADHGLSHMLPDTAMEVSKAFVVEYQESKAWFDSSGRVIIEGWISTEDRDIEKDVTTPEAFLGSMAGYMALGAPLTTEHRLLPNGRNGLERYPVGHVQKAALVRDGQIFAEASHPTDPGEFEHFPNSGTGNWGRAVLTDPVAGSHVMKGNMRGFSWTGVIRLIEPLADGSRKILQVEPWRETTVAAFPVNTKAVVVNARKE